MFTVLRANKVVSSKSLSYGIWMPSLARVRVTMARGIHFNSMGHSAARETGLEKAVKRLELLPEEALYLFERGTLLCYKDAGGEGAVPEDESPILSVQQAFAEMIGTEEITLEKYQVYAYLKRLGYAVTRYKVPSTSPYYPQPPPYAPPPQSRSSWSSRCIGRIHVVLAWLTSSSRPWATVSFRWHQSAGSILSALRVIRTGHKHPVAQPPDKSPYEIFYNIYKPNTPLRKTNPPRPDFQCVVVDANMTRFPSLSQISYLFDQVPESGPIPPRRRGVVGATPPAATKNIQPRNRFERLLIYLKALLRIGPTTPSPRPPHPYAVLRSGKKNIIIAAVDNGNISFFRLGQGAFHEMPML